jgi:putative hydrolase of the HAD superfamily
VGRNTNGSGKNAGRQSKQRAAEMTYKAVIFDFFGVICSEVAPFWLAKHLSKSEAMKVKATTVNDADIGKLSQEELFSVLSQMTKIPPDIIEREWFSYANINAEHVNFLKEISQNYQIGLLTNSPAPFVRSIMSENCLNDLFDSIVVSSEVGYAKPEHRIYDIMLSQLSISPKDALMIDDNPDNISGAAAIGMAGIVFISNSQIKAALSQ